MANANVITAHFILPRIDASLRITGETNTQKRTFERSQCYTANLHWSSSLIATRVLTLFVILTFPTNGFNWSEISLTQMFVVLVNKTSGASAQIFVFWFNKYLSRLMVRALAIYWSAVPIWSVQQVSSTKLTKNICFPRNNINLATKQHS